MIANDSRLMPLMGDKKQAEAKLMELGLNFIPCYPWEQHEQAISEFGFPLVIKPTRETGGSRGVHLVTSRTELIGLGPFIRLESLPIVQPYLGDADSEYTVGILSDKGGNVIDSIVIRRRLTGLSMLETEELRGNDRHHLHGDLAGVRDPAPGDPGILRGPSQAAEQSWPAESPAPRTRRPVLRLRYSIPAFQEQLPYERAPDSTSPDILLRNHLYDEEFGRLRYQADLAAIRAFEHVLIPVGEMCQWR